MDNKQTKKKYNSSVPLRLFSLDQPEQNFGPSVRIPTQDKLSEEAVTSDLSHVRA